MPILKVITGHTSVSGIKNYLEKDGRALAQDFYNLSWDERDMAGYDEKAKALVPWDEEMDHTRAKHDHDREWRGLKARTFKHFVLSPDPEDRIDLEALRDLSKDWVLKHFGDYQIAITYHDDNEHHIPHAHIVVNCTNLRTGYKLHTDKPEDLNRELQNMARERGLRGLSNEREPKTGAERLAAKSEKERIPPKTRQAVYQGRKERGIIETGGYSWVADIRGRVAIAKTLAHSEKEFMALLEKMEVNVAANSEKARRDDWIFSLDDQPTLKVSGERLGMSFAKETLQRRFERKGAYHPTPASETVIRAHAEHAVELNDLMALDELAAALQICSRYGIRSMEDFGRRMSSKTSSSPSAIDDLSRAQAYMAENKLLPQRIEHKQTTDRKKDPERQQTTRTDTAKRQRIIQAQQQEQQRQRRKER